MKVPHVLVLGCGSLAKALCCSLAERPGGALRLTVAARRQAAADEVAYLAGARAHLSDSQVKIDATAVDARHEDQLDSVISRAAPDLLVICASLQSPWEGLEHASAWTELIHHGGFGLTLPLQVDLAVRAAAAVTRCGAQALVINACYPDMVNPVIAALGLPVLCGVGNAGLLAASLSYALGVTESRRLKVLGHHANLAEPENGCPEARAWLDEQPLTEVTRLLSAQRHIPRKDLNLLTGHQSAKLIATLLHGGQWSTSVPGPHGLPGGYPVAVSRGGIKITLPTSLTLPAAIGWNQRVGRWDGVQVTNDFVNFCGAARAALRQYLPDVAEGFRIADIHDACVRIQDLRRRLRTAASDDAAR
jgi:hypothetical protein